MLRGSLNTPKLPTGHLQYSIPRKRDLRFATTGFSGLGAYMLQYGCRFGEQLGTGFIFPEGKFSQAKDQFYAHTIDFRVIFL
jgi:hypothetical protein